MLVFYSAGILTPLMFSQIVKNRGRVSGLLQVAPQVYQLYLFGTSAYLLLDDQITVVDAGWRGCGRRLMANIVGLGRSPEEISHILCTHYHLDHIGGVSHLQKASSALVAAHESEVPFVDTDPTPRLPNPAQNPALALLLSPLIALLRPERFSVDIPLVHASRLDTLGGVEVVHSPGHTPGSVSFHFPREGLLMVGDALQYRGGKLGLPSRWFSTDLAKAKESVRRLAQLDFELLCFSHFPPLKNNASRTLKKFAESLN